MNVGYVAGTFNAQCVTFFQQIETENNISATSTASHNDVNATTFKMKVFNLNKYFYGTFKDKKSF